MAVLQKQKQYLQYSVHVSLEHEYAAEVTRLSLKSYDEGDEFDGGDLMVLGYDTLASSLLSSHPSITVLLEHVVTEVHHNHDPETGGCVVVTDKGAIAGDYVVCTLPLGVLKVCRMFFEVHRRVLSFSRRARLAALASPRRCRVTKSKPCIAWR